MNNKRSQKKEKKKKSINQSINHQNIISERGQPFTWLDMYLEVIKTLEQCCLFQVPIGFWEILSRSWSTRIRKRGGSDASDLRWCYNDEDVLGLIKVSSCWHFGGKTCLLKAPMRPPLWNVSLPTVHTRKWRWRSRMEKNHEIIILL